MELLKSINIKNRNQSRIELYYGDLTSLTTAETFDLLIVSAFPNEYTPATHSLIGALNQKGLSVEELAKHKELDLRSAFSCWLSREFKPRDPRLRFRRILCFEPFIRGRPPELVGDIFRALTAILAERPDIKTVALPVVASGYQGYKLGEMLSPLLDASLHWLETGLPLNCIKIVIHSKAQVTEALNVFTQQKKDYLGFSPIPVTSQIDYDVFISYSRKNIRECKILAQALRATWPDIRIFVDHKEIDIGSPWQPEILENLDRCRKVVALLSPDYLASKVCKEEFNIAWIRCRETNKEILFPIYLYTTPNLPTYMKYRNYLDCREGDQSKLNIASKKILKALELI